MHDRNAKPLIRVSMKKPLEIQHDPAAEKMFEDLKFNNPVENKRRAYAPSDGFSEKLFNSLENLLSKD
jgi:hypothetical protein